MIQPDDVAAVRAVRHVIRLAHGSIETLEELRKMDRSVLLRALGEPSEDPWEAVEFLAGQPDPELHRAAQALLALRPDPLKS